MELRVATSHAIFFALVFEFLEKNKEIKSLTEQKCWDWLKDYQTLKLKVRNRHINDKH
jgi:hypothetical protein